MLLTDRYIVVIAEEKPGLLSLNDLRSAKSLLALHFPPGGDITGAPRSWWGYRPQPGEVVLTTLDRRCRPALKS